MSVEIFCAGFLSLMLFALGLAVSIERGRKNYLTGTPADSTEVLYKLIRAHSNASEYLPILLGLFLYFALTASSQTIRYIIVATTFARVLHAAALILGGDLRRFNGMRFVGGLGTYMGGGLLGAALILRAFKAA
ncbi:MAG: MAPEG family protein [Rhodospirillaceae bacterium]|nr:MAPEG family protein [Rhodospirillaceae bacterium]